MRVDTEAEAASHDHDPPNHPCHARPRLVFRAQGSGLRAQASGFRVQGSGFRVQGLGFGAQGSGFRVQGSGFRVQGSGFRVQGSGFRVQGSGFGVALSSKTPRGNLQRAFPATPIVATVLKSDDLG